SKDEPEPPNETTLNCPNLSDDGQFESSHSNQISPHEMINERPPLTIGTRIAQSLSEILGRYI
ncbi:MAG: hypothetical protein O3C59_05680, partial [Proteobacteria bacterium]|nr:hypothetical protein [Pseudomonadota bacterium]